VSISIPVKLDGQPYSRKEMEVFLRENMLAKNHMLLRQFALKHLRIHSDYFLSCPINLILHWVLDRLIDESSKSDTIKVAGDKIGLAPARNNETYKIKGFDPGGNNDEFYSNYSKILGQFISRKLALMPGENEGINIDEVKRYIEPEDTGYVPPPVPPGVTPLPMAGPSMYPFIPKPTIPPPVMGPVTPTRKPRGRPTTAPTVANEKDTTSLSIELLSRSFRGEIEGMGEKYNILDDKIAALEAKIIALEAKLR
jgi:hypothetical protein